MFFGSLIAFLFGIYLILIDHPVANVIGVMWVVVAFTGFIDWNYHRKVRKSQEEFQ